MSLKKSAQDFYSGITPIRTRVELVKRTPLHPYFTAQPASLIRAYIENFSRVGDTVFDMFGGSGTTAREALLSGRNAIHTDLLPWSCFIAKNSCISPKEIEGISDSFKILEGHVQREISKLYNLSASSASKLSIPKSFPRGVKLPSNSDVELLEDLFTPRNRVALMTLLDGINSVPNKVHREFLQFCFSGILARSSRTYWKDKNGKGGGDSGIFKVYRYWIPKTPDERNVWELFSSRFDRIVNLVEKDNRALNPQNSSLLVKSASATDLKKVVDSDSVDYIYTDPPYAKHIPYLDLSAMYNAFLGFPVTEKMRAQEAIEGGDNAKSVSEYVDLLGGSFAEAYRVLKQNRWMTLVFTHKDPEIFTKIVDAASEAGFDYANAVAQDTKRPSFHKINNAVSVIKGQMMINFVKRNGKAKRRAKPESIPIKRMLVSVATGLIRENGGRATFSEIVHQFYVDLLSDGSIRDLTKDIGTLESILDSSFRKRVVRGELFYCENDGRRLVDI